MRSSHLLIPIACVTLSVVGLSCSRSTQPSLGVQEPVDAPQLAVAEPGTVEASNSFGLRLLGQMAAREQSGKNIFMSPLSISYALGMTYNGAAGETREAMATTLGIEGLDPETVNETYQQLAEGLTGADPNVQLDLANSIWYRLGLSVKQDFLRINRDYFDAVVRELDFSADWAADTINQWVDHNTNGKITKIVPKPISPYTIMYLINAVYFKADWTVTFDSQFTTAMPFHLVDGSTVLCDMMLKEEDVSFYQDGTVKVADLPYGSGAFSMTVVLPEHGVSVNDVIAGLDAQTWTSWLEGLTITELEFRLPRFKLTYETSLVEDLENMGMEVAFTDFADFSNLTDLRCLISDVKHKTFVQVDETGTEVAAVTSVEIGITSVTPPPPQMIVDRPFLIVIHEHSTGAILFMGRIMEPVWED